MKLQSVFPLLSLCFVACVLSRTVGFSLALKLTSLYVFEKNLNLVLPALRHYTQTLAICYHLDTLSCKTHPLVSLLLTGTFHSSA